MKERGGRKRRKNQNRQTDIEETFVTTKSVQAQNDRANKEFRSGTNKNAKQVEERKLLVFSHSFNRVPYEKQPWNISF